MSLPELVTFVFFFIGIGIFLAKVLNVLTIKLKAPKGENAFKFYGKEISIVLLIVFFMCWLIISNSFAVEAAETKFMADYGINSVQYLHYGTYLLMFNIFLLTVTTLTIVELIVMTWVGMWQNRYRPRRNEFGMPKR
jgi:hypothetical protein